MKLTRVESRELFPVPTRAHYVWSLKNGTITFFVEGCEMNEETEIGSVLASYICALNAAEKQIESLLEVIDANEIQDHFSDDYLEEYPEEEDYKSKYKVEDIKDALFHSMMKKDEKMISKYVNQLNVVTDKLKAS